MDDASSTCSQASGFIDHLKRNGPAWYDLDRRRCGEFGEQASKASPHNPFLNNAIERPPTPRGSTSTIYPALDGCVFDSVISPSLRPRDPAMEGVGRHQKVVVAAPADLSTTRTIQTRILPMNHPTRSVRQFSLLDVKALAASLDADPPDQPVKPQSRGATRRFHEDWGRTDTPPRPATPGSRPTSRSG